MRGQKENQQLSAENTVLDMSVLTVLGDRDEQQDSFGFELREQEGLVVVCDGMGGMESGRKASELTVDTFLQDYVQHEGEGQPLSFLLRSAQSANERVKSIANAQGQTGCAGTTLVAVVIRGKKLYWMAAGDSRGYLYRKGELLQFTMDQNYGSVLDQQRDAGRITQEDYFRQSERAEALINYIGVSRLALTDYSQEGLALMSGDRVLVMSDGLYKLVSDAELLRIIENFANPAEALQALEMKAQRKAEQRNCVRDNMTAALIRMK